ncbi:MAG: hypothetical protein H6748_09425 [Spirochaetaceae bacterium]|nr:hypothetical protein [Myxococcales bacterium]MCB9724253.1 hypothetical protein [Spirochaetaceae bacterium]
MSREARQLRCPEDVLGWLPWYAESGEAALGDRERGAVEAHAAECAECRAELDMIAGAPFEIDVALPDPDRLFAEITARLDALSSDASRGGAAARGAQARVIPIERARPLGPADLERLERWVVAGGPGEDEERAAGGAEAGSLWREARAPIFAAAAAILLLLLGGLAGALWSQSQTGRDATYRLATAEQGPGAAGEGARLDVVFSESASAGDVSRLLQSTGLEIVAGPSPLGVYRLRATGSSGEAAERDPGALAEQLRADRAIVIFAEAVP